LSEAVAKPASINLQKWFLSPTGSIKPWFHTVGNLPLCSSYLPLGVPNWVASTATNQYPLRGMSAIDVDYVQNKPYFDDALQVIERMGLTQLLST
jgi:hypothetical protein